MVLRRLINLFPLVLACTLVVYWIYFRESQYPPFEDLSVIDSANQQSVALAVEQITNANEFLISLVTALFGICGYFLNKHKNDLRIVPLAVVYFTCLLLLGLAYYSGFKVQTSLINTISQNAIAILPGSSYCLFYIEELFILCGGTSLILLSILISVFLNSTKLKPI